VNISYVIQAIFLVSFPALVVWGAKKNKVIKALDPVVICYAVGILIGNLPSFISGLSDMIIDEIVAKNIYEPAVVLAIPLLLFSSNVKQWWNVAPKALLSFGLAVFSVILLSILGAVFFQDRHDEAWKIAGMLVGVYTGGSPTMAGIGMAVDIRQETFILINTADVLMGSLYLLFLVTVGFRLARKIFPAFNHKSTGKEGEGAEQVHHADVFGISHVAIGLGLSLIAGVISIGLSYLIFGRISAPFLILGVASMGIVASFNPRVRELPGSFATGQYLLLVFCLSLGSLAALDKLIEAMTAIAGFLAFTMVAAIVLHFVLSYFFKIDADTLVITSVAAIYGPAFVGLVASTMKNRKVVPLGVTTGVIGDSVGMYLGMMVAYLPTWFG
jgi:uncharacterized membrane protein